MSLEINIFSFEIIICSLEIGYILLRNRHMFFRNEFFVETHTEDLWTAAISVGRVACITSYHALNQNDESVHTLYDFLFELTPDREIIVKLVHA